MTDATVIALAGVVTTLGGLAFQGWMLIRKFEQSEKEATRQRAWQIEDARRTAADLAVKTDRVASELKKETMANRETMNAHVADLAARLDHNTELTGKAYDAANNFEAKLSQLASVFDSVHTDREVRRTLDEIKKTMDETSAIVQHELQPEVPTTIKEMIKGDEHG